MKRNEIYIVNAQPRSQGNVSAASRPLKHVINEREVCPGNEVGACILVKYIFIYSLLQIFFIYDS